MKKIYVITPEWPGVEGYDFKIDIDFDSREDAEKYCKEHSVSFYYIEELIPNRELFFQDIMARIPYGVKFRFDVGDNKYKIITICSNNSKDMPWLGAMESYWMRKGYYIPYLRPMSSMTEEEKREYYIIYDSSLADGTLYNVIDWLNLHHIDYRKLIEKGLALPAPEGMYKEK